MRHVRLPMLLLAPLLAVSTSCGQTVREDGAARLDAEERSRLVSDLYWLADDARNGRRAGSEDAAAVRRWLVERFAQTGLDALEMPFDLDGRRAAANLVVTVPGTGPGDAVIVVTAHFDHLGVRNGIVYNGADDNASGTAALLALARELRQAPPVTTIVLAALDAEEVGLLGALAFVEAPPVPLDRIALNVNLDMLGRSDAGELFAAGPGRYPALRPPLEDVAARAPVRLRFGHDDVGSGSDDWTMQSDHGAFHRAGVPFVYLGVEDHEDYHRPTDDADRIDPTFFAGAVETTLLVIEAMDAFVAGSAGSP